MVYMFLWGRNVPSTAAQDFTYTEAKMQHVKLEWILHSVVGMILWVLAFLFATPSNWNPCIMEGGIVTGSNPFAALSFVIKDIKAM